MLPCCPSGSRQAALGATACTVRERQSMQCRGSSREALAVGAMRSTHSCLGTSARGALMSRWCLDVPGPKAAACVPSQLPAAATRAARTPLMLNGHGHGPCSHHTLRSRHATSPQPLHLHLSLPPPSALTCFPRGNAYPAPCHHSAPSNSIVAPLVQGKHFAWPTFTAASGGPHAEPTPGRPCRPMKAPALATGGRCGCGRALAAADHNRSAGRRQQSCGFIAPAGLPSLDATASAGAAGSGTCHLRLHQLHQQRGAPSVAAYATARERDAVLQWVSPDNRKEIARILEIADRAADRWEVTWTDFLPPPVVADAMAVLAGRADVVCVPWGGYAQAERCR